MRWLTYADRELLLNVFDSLKDESDRTDSQLLTVLSEWARRVTPTFGFEQALLSDVTALSKFLLDYGADRDVAGIARGALLYVLHGDERASAGPERFGLLGDAFVVNYAVWLRSSTLVAVLSRVRHCFCCRSRKPRA